MTGGSAAQQVYFGCNSDVQSEEAAAGRDSLNKKSRNNSHCDPTDHKCVLRPHRHTYRSKITAYLAVIHWTARLRIWEQAPEGPSSVKAHNALDVLQTVAGEAATVHLSPSVPCQRLQFTLLYHSMASTETIHSPDSV